MEQSQRWAIWSNPLANCVSKLWNSSRRQLLSHSSSVEFRIFTWWLRRWPHQCRNRLVLSMDVYIFFFCSLLYLYMYFCQIVLVTCTVYCMSHTVYCMTQRLQPRVNNSCLLSSCGCLHAPSSFPPLQITTEPLSYNTGTDIRSWPL